MRGQCNNKILYTFIFNLNFYILLPNGRHMLIIKNAVKSGSVKQGLFISKCKVPKKIFTQKQSKQISVAFKTNDELSTLYNYEKNRKLMIFVSLSCYLLGPFE